MTSSREIIQRGARTMRLLPEAEKAAAGLPIDPGELAAWVVEQDDPEWTRPSALLRWAEIISERGFPE